MPTQEHPGIVTTSSTTTPTGQAEQLEYSATNLLAGITRRVEAEAELNARLGTDVRHLTPAGEVALAQAHATLALSLRLGAAQHADGTIHVFSQ